MKPKKTITVKLNYHFIDWILEDFSTSVLAEAWSEGNSIEDFAIGVMGDFIYIEHINNWEEIKPKLNESYYDENNYDFVSKDKGVLFGDWCEEKYEFVPFSETDKYEIVYICEQNAK